MGASVGSILGDKVGAKVGDIVGSMVGFYNRSSMRVMEIVVLNKHTAAVTTPGWATESVVHWAFQLDLRRALRSANTP